MSDSMAARNRDNWQTTEERRAPEIKPPAPVAPVAKVEAPPVIDLVKLPPKLAAAIVKAQGEIETAAIDKVNEHIKRGYSSVNAIIEATIQPMKAAGLGLVLESSEDLRGRLALSHVLIHESGDGLRIRSDIPIDGKGATARGTAESYRYKFLLLQLMKIPRGDPSDEAEEVEPTKRGRGNQEPRPEGDAKVREFERLSKAIGAELACELCGQSEGWKPETPKDFGSAIYKLRRYQRAAEGYYNAVLSFDESMAHTDDPEVRRQSDKQTRAMKKHGDALPVEEARRIRAEANKAREQAKR